MKTLKELNVKVFEDRGCIKLSVAWQIGRRMGGKVIPLVIRK